MAAVIQYSQLCGNLLVIDPLAGIDAFSSSVVWLTAGRCLEAGCWETGSWKLGLVLAAPGVRRPPLVSFSLTSVIPYKTTKLLRLRCPDRPCIFYSYCSQDSDLLFYGYPIYNVDLLFNEYPIYDVRLPGSTIP